MDKITTTVARVASTRAALWAAEDVLAEGGTEDEAFKKAILVARRVRKRFEQKVTQ